MDTITRWAGERRLRDLRVAGLYAVAALVLGGMALHAWRRHRLSGDELARLQPPSGGGHSGGRGGGGRGGRR